MIEAAMIWNEPNNKSHWDPELDPDWSLYADTVIRALMDVQLRTEIPVFSAVVTPDEFHDTDESAAFFRAHFAARGVEVAAACAETLLSLERLRGQVAAGIV